MDDFKIVPCVDWLAYLFSGYQAMGFYLNRTERPILFSCSWPACSGGQV